MAGFLMVVIIGSLGTVSMGGTSFLAEPELDTFSNYVKMSFLGGKRGGKGIKKGWKVPKVASHLIGSTNVQSETVSHAHNALLK